MEPSALAKNLTERYKKLQSDRLPWDSLARDIATYVIPRRLPGMDGAVMSPSTADGTLLFDTTAVHANMTLANGQLAWMSPQESVWFAYEPMQEGDDESKLWLADASTTAREELAVSNFYTAIHEAYLDRSGFGTCCLYIEEGKKNAITAQHWPYGTYVIDEDSEGMVDTVIREFKLTPRAAAQKFGEENLSQVTREALKNPQKANEKKCYLHAIYPRLDAERDKAKLDGPNKPIAAVYIETETNHICRTSGYDEMPCMVSRFLEWGTATGSGYGWAPAFTALPDARQTNFLQKMGDALAEKKAFPPVLAPEELEGEIDTNAYGVTYFQANTGANQMPREWATAGDYNILNDRVKLRQESINRAFYVDLFQMFAQLDKVMTAREVAERSSEKLIQFSPTFSRVSSELLGPALERVFGILARSGRLGMVPQTLAGQPYRIQYSSRLALALRALPAIGYQRSLERVLAIAAIHGEVLDNYDLDRAERDTALSDGVPPSFLRKASDVQKIRDARAEAEAQARQMEQAAAGAKALSDVGSVKPDSVAGKIVEGQFAAA